MDSATLWRGTRGKIAALGLIACAALFYLAATDHALAFSDLAQKPGANGCIVDGGASGCQAGRGLAGAKGIVVSPDGKSVYAVSAPRDPAASAIAVFDRDPQTGVLTQKAGAAGCIAAKARSGCGEGGGLGGAQAVAVSPDGLSVYVAGYTSDAVAVFDRNPQTGALTQKAGAAGCLSLSGTDGVGHTCAPARGLDGASGVVVSPNGKNVYVASEDSGAVTTFARDPATGALVQLPGQEGCVSDAVLPGCAKGSGLFTTGALAISANGADVYAASANNGIAIFTRDPTTGVLSQGGPTSACVSEDGLEGCRIAPNIDAQTVAVTPDGRSVYGGGIRDNPSIGLLDRDPVTGSLSASAAPCTSKSGQPCPAGTGLEGVAHVAVGPDGTSVYAISADVIAIFDRNPETRALVQRPGGEGCISADGKDPGCAHGRETHGAAALSFSPDGKNAYLAASGSGAIDVFDPAVPDLQAPLISEFKLTPSRIPARGKHVPSFRFSLSEPATVKIEIERISAGRRVGKACKAPTPKLARRRRCTRIAAVETLGVGGQAGTNKTAFPPKVGRRKLPPGAYRATIRAEDESGNQAPPLQTSFRVLGAKKRR